MQDQSGKTVKILWHFAESPQAVWRAWTDANIVRQWFGSDPNGEVLNVFLDVRLNGSFEITFANADQTVFTCGGTYTQIELHRKLVFSWTWKNNPDIVEWVTVLLEEEQNGTLMRFEIANIDASTTHGYEAGWKTTFEKLVRAMRNMRNAD